MKSILKFCSWILHHLSLVPVQTNLALSLLPREQELWSVSPVSPTFRSPLSSRGRLKGLCQQQAGTNNLNELNEVMELSQYLSTKGDWELFITNKNGNCMYSSFLKGTEGPEEYRPMHLRYQLDLFCCVNHGFCFTVLKNHIMGKYSHPRISRQEYLKRQQLEDNLLSDAELADHQRLGSFSFITHLKHLLG